MLVSESRCHDDLQTAKERDLQTASISQWFRQTCLRNLYLSLYLWFFSRSTVVNLFVCYQNVCRTLVVAHIWKIQNNYVILATRNTFLNIIHNFSIYHGQRIGWEIYDNEETVASADSIKDCTLNTNLVPFACLTWNITRLSQNVWYIIRC